MMNDWGMGWGGGMWFVPVFGIGLIVLLIILAVPLYGRARRDSPRVVLRTPREILDERFAKGEIEREEYEARRKALTNV